jgi:hypothetical protein
MAERDERSRSARVRWMEPSREHAPEPAQSAFSSGKRDLTLTLRLQF